MKSAAKNTISKTQIHLREMQVIGRATREWIVHSRQCPALRQLGIQYAGLTHAGAGFAFCRLAPNIAVIFGSLSGAGQVLIRGQWKPCRAGDIYLAPAGVPHAYHALKQKPWQLCWVAYEEQSRHIIHAPEPILRRDSADALRHAIMGLYSEMHALNEPPAIHHWAELINLSARRLIHEQQIDPRLIDLWTHVDTNLSTPWTLHSLAQRVHLSPEQLRHLCQKHLNRSPMAHLTHLRLQRAAVLLVRTNEKIAVIARTVGYQNPFAFSTAFKRHTGITPSTFNTHTSP